MLFISSHLSLPDSFISKRVECGMVEVSKVRGNPFPKFPHAHQFSFLGMLHIIALEINK